MEPPPRRDLEEAQQLQDEVHDQEDLGRDHPAPQSLDLEEAELKEQRKIILSNFSKRHKERFSFTTVLFIIILLLFVISIVKIVFSLKNKVFGNIQGEKFSNELLVTRDCTNPYL